MKHPQRYASSENLYEELVRTCKNFTILLGRIPPVHRTIGWKTSPKLVANNDSRHMNWLRYVLLYKQQLKSCRTLFVFCVQNAYKIYAQFQVTATFTATKLLRKNTEKNQTREIASDSFVGLIWSEYIKMCAINT